MVRGGGRRYKGKGRAEWRGSRVHIQEVGWEKCACEVDQSNVKHIESITVYRGLLINSKYSRSYSQIYIT